LGTGRARADARHGLTAVPAPGPGRAVYQPYQPPVEVVLDAGGKLEFGGTTRVVDGWAATAVVVVVDAAFGDEVVGADVDAVPVEVVVVVLDGTGEVQPAGGVPVPGCPGISTVPAHPKSDRVTEITLVPPSPKAAVETAWRM
jgi:hypothetical protein